MENKNILLKLHAIMSEVDFIEKDARNDFHKYRYASEHAIKKTIHPLLVKHKVLLTVNIDDVKREDTVTTSKILYSFIDVETGEQLDGVFYGAGEDKSDKGLYKSLTGAIKYILTTTFLIPTGDDPESEDKPLKRQNASSKPVSAYQQLRTKVLFEKDPVELEKKKAALMDKPDVVSPQEYKELVSLIDSQVKKLDTKTRKKEVKEDARNAAEVDIQSIDSMEVEQI